MPGQARALLVEHLEQGIDTRQRRRIGDSRALAQLGAHDAARRRDVALRGRPRLFGSLLQRAQGDRILAVPDRDVEAANGERALERPDMGSRQGDIGVNVAMPEGIELAADGRRHVDGEQRDRAHQREDDEADGEDLHADRDVAAAAADHHCAHGSSPILISPCGSSSASRRKILSGRHPVQSGRGIVR